MSSRYTSEDFMDGGVSEPRQSGGLDPVHEARSTPAEPRSARGRETQMDLGPEHSGYSGRSEVIQDPWVTPSDPGHRPSGFPETPVDPGWGDEASVRPHIDRPSQRGHAPMPDGHAYEPMIAEPLLDEPTHTAPPLEPFPFEGTRADSGFGSPMEDAGIGPASFDLPLLLEKEQDRHYERSLLGKLVVLYGLDVHKGRGMNRRAETELKKGAMLLTIVAGFEMFMWTTFWLAAINGGRLDRLSVASIILAPLIGFAISAAVLHFETQIFTASPGRGIRFFGFGLAFVGRLAIVVLSAFATAQPFELLMFGAPIARRAHEEQVIQEALETVSDIRDAQTQVTSLDAPAAPPERIVTKVDDIQRDLVSAQVEVQRRDRAVKSSQGKLATIRKGKAYWQKQLDAASTDAEREEADAKLDQRKSWERYRSGELAKEQAALQAAQDEVARLKLLLAPQKATLKAEVAKAEAEQKNKKQLAEGVEQELKDYVLGLRDLPTEPGVKPTVTMASGRKLSFTTRAYDFFERLRVLNDLLEGRQPMWPEYSKSDTFLWEDLRLPPPGDTPEGVTAEQLRRPAAKSFRQMYWAIFGFAMLLPMLGILNKLLIPRALKEYFAQPDESASEFA